MRILFDQGTPRPLRSHLIGHQVRTAYQEGWGELSNGDLLSTAERAGFEALVTTDQNLPYQQNLSGRQIAILVLPTTSWLKIQEHVEEVSLAVNNLKPGAFVELNW